MVAEQGCVFEERFLCQKTYNKSAIVRLPHDNPVAGHSRPMEKPWQWSQGTIGGQGSQICVCFHGGLTVPAVQEKPFPRHLEAGLRPIGTQWTHGRQFRDSLSDPEAQGHNALLVVVDRARNRQHESQPPLKPSALG